ncbi:MAG TPA: hypothetical protein VIQ11_13065, partial [Mycobacterium sp.]
LRFKRWGATAVFDVDGTPVVVKHAKPVLYPHAPAVHQAVQDACPGATAPLLEHATGNGWQRTVFALVPGPTAAETGPDSLPAVAAALGEVQAAVARTDLTDLPGYRVESVPDLLVEDLRSANDQDVELLSTYTNALPALRDHAAALAAVPASLDHPDLNESNAIVDHGKVVLLDWEEAMVGCPLLSLDRLLAETGDTEAIIGAYCDSFGVPKDLVDSAGVIAPLKLAIEARAYARGLGMPHPHTRLTADKVHQCLDRLAALSAAPPRGAGRSART